MKYKIGDTYVTGSELFKSFWDCNKLVQNYKKSFEKTYKQNKELLTSEQLVNFKIVMLKLHKLRQVIQENNLEYAYDGWVMINNG